MTPEQIAAKRGHTLWDTIRSDLKKQGMDLSDATLHTFRHTCITDLVKVMPIQKVSIWAGHASVTITMKRYGHLVASDFLDCVTALDAPDVL